MYVTETTDALYTKIFFQILELFICKRHNEKGSGKHFSYLIHLRDDITNKNDAIYWKFIMHSQQSSII